MNEHKLLLFCEGYFYTSMPWAGHALRATFLRKQVLILKVEAAGLPNQKQQRESRELETAKDVLSVAYREQGTRERMLIQRCLLPYNPI